MNVEALNVFLACSDDWKQDAKGRYKSIDKTAMKAVMDMMNISNTSTMLTDMIAMQDAVLEVIKHG